MPQPYTAPAFDHDLYRKPFALDEHGFVGGDDKNSEPNGNVYIKKTALRKRLTEIDPRWQLGKPEVMEVTGDVVLMTGSLTLEGVTRWAVGTGIIQSTVKDKQTKEIKPVTGFELAKAISKAYKTAAVDLIPRLGNEFEIGGYLKDIPKNVRTRSALETWLMSQKHWATNGGGKFFQLLMGRMGLSWEIVAAGLESGKKLEKLSETTLTYDNAILRLLDLRPTLPTPATPVTIPANPTKG